MPTANQPASRPARKAVIPVAGMGTRFLPATKAVPKELLPVVDRPALQYIVEEAARAGLREVLMVTGRNKAAIEDYFDRHPELETALEKKGDADRLASVHASTDVAQVHFVRQGEARGLGHAVLQAAAFVGDEPFAVLLGDDLIDARDHLLEHMLAVQAEHGGSVIALLDVGMENIDKYGAVAIEPARRPPWTATRSCASPGWWRSRRSRRHPAAWPSSAGTCSRPRCSRCCARPRRAAVARSS